MTLPLFTVTLVVLAVALAAVMTGAWLVWRQTLNSGWVDTVWTFGLGGVGVFGALPAPAAVDATGWRPLLVAVLVAVWAARLGLHIAGRTRGITDDPRYAKLREDWGDKAVPQMFVLLQKQAIVSVPLAAAIVFAAWNPVGAFRLQDALAVAILLVGVVGEAVADEQLRGFRANPDNRGKVCDAGLWAWSRHPNYFFEWLCWVAFALLAITWTGSYPWGWLALAAPASMYWLLRYVTGVPPLEEHMLATRGDAFRAYQARTSAFFPMPQSPETRS